LPNWSSLSQFAYHFEGPYYDRSLSPAFSFPILEVNMEMPAKRFRWGGCLLAFTLAATLCGQPALKVFASQEQGKPEKTEERSESEKQAKKQAKKERKA
jgi:hypothetical protein